MPILRALPTARTAIRALIVFAVLRAGEAHAQATPRKDGTRAASRSTYACDLPKIESIEEVEEPHEMPVLANRSEVGRLLSRYYPPGLRDQGTSGEAMVRAHVLESGLVDPETICVLRASHQDFGRAAMQVVERARFLPARVNGKPVPFWLTLPIEFSLAR